MSSKTLRLGNNERMVAFSEQCSNDERVVFDYVRLREPRKAGN